MTSRDLTRNRKLQVREMTIDDLPEVFHIGESVFTAEYSPTLYRTWDEYEITTLFNSDSDLCLVGELDGRIVGFALGTTVEKQRSPWKYGYLVWLGVRPDIQKARVGHGLFREIKRRMREQGVRMIMVDTSADNRAAIAFFRKEGFRKPRQHVYLTLNLSRKRKKRARHAAKTPPADPS
jgi:ribosomal protein S18 acetylase RimI-like enzyme